MGQLACLEWHTSGVDSAVWVPFVASAIARECSSAEYHRYIYIWQTAHQLQVLEVMP